MILLLSILLHWQYFGATSHLLFLFFILLKIYNACFCNHQQYKYKVVEHLNTEVMYKYLKTVRKYNTWVNVLSGGAKCLPMCIYVSHPAPTSNCDLDQRIATVCTVSHEVILSASLRLRSLYANIWWCSGLLWEGSIVFYSYSWKADITVDQTFKVNTKGPCPGPSHRMSQFALISMLKHLSIPDTNTDKHTFRHTLTILRVQAS